MVVFMCRYMPAKEGPYYMKSMTDRTAFMDRTAQGFSSPRLPVGLVREFQVRRFSPPGFACRMNGSLLAASQPSGHEADCI